MVDVKNGLRESVKLAMRLSRIDRKHFATARLGYERHAVALFGTASPREGGRILCYHTIGQEEWGTNDVTPKQFRRQIESSLEAGFKFVPASQIAATGGADNELAITFDDGLKSVLTQAAPILKDYNVPWTFFPVTDWSDGKHWMGDDFVMDWHDVEACLALGAEMGSHSATHPSFGDIGRGQMADELGGSRDVFLKRIGIAPDTFAIPFGQSKDWTDDSDEIAREVGYKTIYAQAEETRYEGTVPRTFVTKFDSDYIYRAILNGKFDNWEEWY